MPKGTQIARKQMYHFWKPTIAIQRRRRNAHKEIYRTDHVLYHVVHYSFVTKTTATFYNDSDTSSWGYSDINVEEPVHVVDEVNEAVMMHGRFAEGTSSTMETILSNPR
jgi:hypothetical protein